MREQILDEVVARRFLLGELSTEEQERIEELAFGDPQSFALLEAVEDDLIDEFVYNDLSAEERKRFQQYFLTQPGRSEDLRIADALRQHLDREFPRPSLWQRLLKFFHLGPSPLPALATGAITVAAIIIIAILVRERFRKTPSQPVEAEKRSTPALPTPTSTPGETPVHTSPSPAHQNDQNKPALPRRPTSAVYSFLLTPGGPDRGDSEATPVSKKSRSVEFQLPLTGTTTYRSYKASLEKENGQAIQTWTVKPSRITSGNGVRVSVPSSQLEVSQRYRIVLKGIAANGNLQFYDEYYFVVRD
ncbi:MAG TPA: hypothetical protein VFI24_06915 [Pyrinomonadaceae bacterium]|nr:hypothetical protein [Pyrinomonadaceae bacterium]